MMNNKLFSNLFKTNENYLNLLKLLILDLLGVSFSFYFGYLIKFGISSENLFSFLGLYKIYWKIFLFNSFLWLLIFNLFRLYQLEKIERVKSLSFIFLGTTFGALFSFTATIVFPEFTYAKSIIFWAYIFSILILFILRNFFVIFILKWKR